MFCSTIIPTVNRPTLDKSIESVLEQNFSRDDFEVIVVNDSGQPLPAADWQTSPRVRIIQTQRRKLSVARNTGAAIARGKYLHFLDDDDWLLPHALETFWQLAWQAPSAAMLYGGAIFINAAGQNLGEINLNMSGNCASQIIGGAWIPAQAAFVKSDMFFSLGGYNPLFGPAEEVELNRRLSLKGELAYTSAAVVAILRGEGWESTVDYPRATAYNRWSRDIALSEPGAFRRMLASANSGYWHGRIVQVYLAGFRWSWQRKRFTSSASRLLMMLTAILTAGRHIFSPDFWQALKDTHVPCSQARVLRQ